MSCEEKGAGPCPCGRKPCPLRTKKLRADPHPCPTSLSGDPVRRKNPGCVWGEPSQSLSCEQNCIKSPERGLDLVEKMMWSLSSLRGWSAPETAFL